MDKVRPHHRTPSPTTISTQSSRTNLRNHPAHNCLPRQQTSPPLRSLHLRYWPHLRSRLIRQRPLLDASPSNRPPQPQLRHRRRRSPGRPHRPHLQQHHHRPNSAQPRHQRRWRTLQNLRHFGRPARRVLLPRHYSRQSRRTRHHLHVESQAHSLRHRTLSQRTLTSPPNPGAPYLDFEMWSSCEWAPRPACWLGQEARPHLNSSHPHSNLVIMNPLVTPSWLSTRLQDPNIIILDATLPPVGVTPPIDTHARYLAQHIPN